MNLQKAIQQMQEDLKKFAEIRSQDMENSITSISKTPLHWIDNLQEEIKELKEAIVSSMLEKNGEQTEEEAGDVIGTVVSLYLSLLLKYPINGERIWEIQEKKLKKRKPWTFGKGLIPKNSIEEQEMYNQNKEREKQND